MLHQRLSLGILVELHPSGPPPSLEEELRELGANLGIQIETEYLSAEDYNSWQRRDDSESLVVSMFAPCLRTGHLAAVSRILYENNVNIRRMHRLSARAQLGTTCDNTRSAFEFEVEVPSGFGASLREPLYALAQSQGFDLAVQSDDLFRRNRRMIAFDMDSTLIQAECIDEIAKLAGVGEQVSAVTEAAMRGELDFNQSLNQRLQLLKGFPVEKLEILAEQIPLTPGVEKLISTVRLMGYKTAVISGGFTYFGERLAKRLEMDYVHANVLDVAGGKLTGKVVGDIVNAEGKANYLRKTAKEAGIHMQQVVAVGDGANDLPMLSAAGLGIAFHAKPKVREAAKQRISTVGLDGVLYLMGIRDREIPEQSL